MKLTRAQRKALHDWHVNQSKEAAYEEDYIEARYHQEQAEDLQDPEQLVVEGSLRELANCLMQITDLQDPEQLVVEGSLRELANCLMQITRDHPCATQALGIVSNCADHLRAIACCLDAAKKEAK